MSDELPRGWAPTTLNEMVGPDGLLTDGDWILSAHLKTGRDVRLIQLADVGSGHFLDKSERFVSYETAKSLGVTYLKEGDVLISRMADPLARACRLPKLEKPAITAVDVAIARCDGRVSVPNYLMHLCNSYRVLQQAEELAVGTTRKRISRKNLEQINVPLPPLNEQRRIVSKLEQLLDKVDSCQKRLEKIPTLLKRFRQAVLAAACSGRLTADWRNENNEPVPPQFQENDLDLPNSWRTFPLSKCIRISAGEAFKKSEYSLSGVKLLQIANVSFGKVIWDQQNFLPSSYLNSHSNLVLRSGEIVMALNRPLLNWRIKVARMTKDDLPAILYQRVGRISPINGSPDLHADYLFLFLQSDYFIHELNSRLRGTDQPYINPPDMLEILIGVPPRAEQQEIVRRVHILLVLAEQIEARYKKAKEYIDNLKQSILAKAFRGELVPQDPSDEPAAVLLESIRKARANQQSDRSRQRRRGREQRSTRWKAGFVSTNYKDERQD